MSIGAGVVPSPTPMIITLITTNKQHSASGILFIASGTLLSTMVDTTPLVDSENEKKIGHKFFGCCCDSKRAALVFNILNIIGYLIWVIYQIFVSFSSIGALWAYYIIGFGVYFLAWVGTQSYNKWMVIPAALWAEISLILVIVYSFQGRPSQIPPAVMIVIAFIWQGLAAYANWTFVHEVNKGIMSPVTYKKREEHSCCCV